MSDSELSDAPSQAVPPDAQLEKALRQEVRKAHEAGDEYTVRTIRDACEKNLDLSSGFFKEHEEWKARSSKIIKEESENVQANEESQKQTSVTGGPPKSTKKAMSPDRSLKRAVPSSGAVSRKKVKTSPNDDTAANAAGRVSDENDGVRNLKTARTQEKKTDKGSKPAASSTKSVKARRDVKTDTSDEQVADDDGLASSESEMSVVLDDEPVKRHRGTSKGTSEAKAKPTVAKSKATGDTDPDKEEIKRLQGQLVKCGVRKVWGKELKPYETSKAKINHLREMLADVGMTGRFSNDKAAQIKEARELAADIEAVQEGAQRWGKSDDEDGDSKTRGGRRLVRGAQNYDFLSSDGEETD